MHVSVEDVSSSNEIASEQDRVENIKANLLQ